MKTTAAIALALVAGCAAPADLEIVDHTPDAVVVDEAPACTAARCGPPPRGATTVGDFAITDATFSGEIFGSPTPDEAQVDIRGGVADGALWLDLWMKEDGRDGNLWVHTLSIAFDVDNAGAIVDGAALIDRSVCSGVEAFDPDQWGTVCTFPTDVAVVVVDGVVSFELAREAARTAVGGSFRVTAR